jgi:hypothetical protein
LDFIQNIAGEEGAAAEKGRIEYFWEDEQIKPGYPFQAKMGVAATVAHPKPQT